MTSMITPSTLFSRSLTTTSKIAGVLGGTRSVRIVASSTRFLQQQQQQQEQQQYQPPVSSSSLSGPISVPQRRPISSTSGQRSTGRRGNSGRRSSDAAIARAGPSSVGYSTKLRLRMIPPELEGKALPFVDVDRYRLLQERHARYEAAVQADKAAGGTGKNIPIPKEHPDEPVAVLPALGIWVCELRGMELMVGYPANTPVVILREEPDGSYYPIFHEDALAMNAIFPMARAAADEIYSVHNEKLIDPDSMTAEQVRRAFKNGVLPEVKREGRLGEPIQLRWTPETLTMTGQIPNTTGPNGEELYDENFEGFREEEVDNVINEVTGKPYSDMKKATEYKTKVNTLFSLDFDGHKYHVAKWTEPMYILSRKDLSAPATSPRILLSEEEQEQIMPLLDEADFDLVEESRYERMEREIAEKDAQMYEEMNFQSGTDAEAMRKEKGYQG